MEEELQAYMQVLESQGVDMKTSLVDNEGFPRNDIDVYLVRNTRHRIVCLQNDCRALMKEIELKLVEFHAK